MNKKVESFYLSSRLPGYLFVLANLCDIHDRILLRCPDAQRGFFSAMLTKIGLTGQVNATASDKNQHSCALCICESWQDVVRSLLIDTDRITVFLLPSQMFEPNLEDLVEAFLSQHPNAIFVNEIQNGVAEKTFAVWVSQGCAGFTKLKKNMLRYTLNKAI